MTDVGIAAFLVLGELYRRRCAQPAVGCGLLSAYNGLPGTAAEVNYYFGSIRMVFLVDYFLSAGYQDLEVNQFDIIDVEVAGEMSITDNQKMPLTRLPRQVTFAAP